MNKKQIIGSIAGNIASYVYACTGQDTGRDLRFAEEIYELANWNTPDPAAAKAPAAGQTSWTCPDCCVNPCKCEFMAAGSSSGERPESDNVCTHRVQEVGKVVGSTPAPQSPTHQPDELPLVIDERAYTAAMAAYDAAFSDATGVTYDGLKAAIEAYEAAKSKPQSHLAKRQPCGCVVCTCEADDQCSGCGAKHCGKHPIGEFPEGGLWTFGEEATTPFGLPSVNQHFLTKFNPMKDFPASPVSATALRRALLYVRHQRHEDKCNELATIEAVLTSTPMRESVIDMNWEPHFFAEIKDGELVQYSNAIAFEIRRRGCDD